MEITSIRRSCPNDRAMSAVPPSELPESANNGAAAASEARVNESGARTANKLLVAAGFHPNLGVLLALGHTAKLNTAGYQ